MNTTDTVRKILRDALQIGARADAMVGSDRLLGAIPEFDSMVVVSVVTLIEERCGVTIDDDELSADVFESFGSLVAFVEAKLKR
ncbi:MAG: acyl carrier protein [Steroidobacteraceae bacterium]